MSQNIKFKYRHDITALENTYGELSKGKVIEVTIQELQKICPRDYIKIIAWNGLKNYLSKTFEVELSLSSRKTKVQK